MQRGGHPNFYAEFPAMKAPANPDKAERTVLFHRRHARRQRGKAIGHMLPAFILLGSIWEVFTGAKPLTGLTVLEFGIGAAYLVLMVRELLLLRRHPHHQEPVAWLEIAAAGILALEGYHIWHRHHEADLARGTQSFHALPYVYWVLAGVYLWLAFGLKHLIARRHLHLHGSGFSGRTTLLGRAFEFGWADIAAVEPAGAADLVIRRTNGQQHRFSFAGIHDGPAQRDGLLAHIQNQLAVNKVQ
jgi:hypothetical protein